MDSVEIDYELANQVLSKEDVAKMKHFDVYLFDIAQWQKDYEPCISSLFICCSVGSFSDHDDVYGDYFVHNGTLVGTAEISEIYYKAWLEKQNRVDKEGRIPLTDDGYIIKL